MTYRVYFSRPAQADLFSIIDFISADNPEKALSFVDALQRRSVEMLAEFPKTSRKYKSMRYLVFDNYIVAYDIDETARAVHILLVSEGHRLWRELLDART